jgi:molecular chaperone Hsp33
MNDFLERYIFENKDIRACYVSLEQALSENNNHHHYSESIQNMLGEFMTACALLSSSLKFEGRLVLQLRSNSEVPLIMAECNNEGRLRAYAQTEDEEYKLSFVDLKSGTLAFTIQPDEGEAYQGIVPLDGDSLSQCLQFYFMQSEQLESYFFMQAEKGQARGFMLQQLPAQLQPEKELRDRDWEDVQTLAETLSIEELFNLASLEIMHRLYHQDEVRFLERCELGFSCSCSKEKMEKALVSLGRNELEEILLEQGQIDMACEFCGMAFLFEHKDVARMFNDDGVLH